MNDASWKPSEWDHFRATLAPRIRKDIRPEVAAFIGMRCVWVASWKIDNEHERGGPYEGQYACHVDDRNPDGSYARARFPWWVPFEDLTDVEPMRFNEEKGSWE